MRSTLESCQGFSSQATENLGLPVPWLLFADDMVGMAVSPSILQTLLEWLEDYMSGMALEFNAGKCKVMKMGSRREIRQEDQIKMGGVTLEYVEEFKYLGIIFDRMGSPKVMVQDRMDKGKIAMPMLFKLLHKWEIRRDPQVIKWMVPTLIDPVLTFGSGLWGPYCCNNDLKNDLERGLLKFWRSYLGLLKSETSTGPL